MARKFDLRRLAIRFVFLGLLAIAGLFAMSWSAETPDFPAEAGGESFASCPESPNCVSTQSSSDTHQMKPIPWAGSSEAATERIEQTIASEFSRAKLVVEQPHYLRYEFSSLVIGFIDDVEFLIDERTRLIQFRSASRVGHSDMGVNRDRMSQFARCV